MSGKQILAAPSRNLPEWLFAPIRVLAGLALVPIGARALQATSPGLVVVLTAGTGAGTRCRLLTLPPGMDLSTSMSDQPAALRRWHAVVTSKDPALLGDLLAEEVVFRSPAVFAPQEARRSRPATSVRR